jgi:predicted ATPase/DNA-binding SARP family transcriptional activator
MSVRLRLFGAPALESDGHVSMLPFERRTQLMAYLALKRGWIARAELATLLWPEQETKLAYANLRKILFRLQSMPAADRIEVQGSAVRLDAVTDVFEFETALRDDRLADALAIRRGELLDGFDAGGGEAWASWLSFERDRLRAAWRGAALTRLDEDLDASEAVDLSARLLDADPLDEAALAAHMTWLARSGQSARARSAFRDFGKRLAEDLGLDPGPELKALHDSIAAGGVSTPAVARAMPAADGEFIGRSVELRQIADLLAKNDCRLLTIVGQGGVGKTRLAQRALDERSADFTDGGAFVPLDDVAMAAEFGGRLARDIGVEWNKHGEPLDQAIEYLRARQLLLVLDNFEQLADGATSTIGRVLQACPKLKIVVTSRVRLGLPGEWLLPLEGLPCPEIEDADRVDAFDAARLFVRAAHRVEPALLPSAEAGAIVDICRQVDGLPLALELAAAWTRVLSCAAIATELREGTELLRAVDATRPARHASFDVVFEQSWRLLTAVERNTLSRLAVFRGGFTAEAARAVAGASFPVLGALADKSLLRKDDARLFLHPLIHQLTRLRFDQSASRAATEKTHALYFHRVLCEARPAVESGDRDALAKLDIEFENCRIAWRWAVAHGAGDALRDSTLSLFHFCDHRDRYDEGLALLAEALGSSAAAADPMLSGLLLAATAHLQYRLDRYADAIATAAKALTAARSMRGTAMQTLALQVLGSCNLRLGNLADAQRHFSKALQHAQAGTEPRKIAVMLANRALVEKAAGRYDEALRLSFESLAQYRRVGDVAGEALTLNNLGVLYGTLKQYESATMHYRSALAICERHGLLTTRALVLSNLTEIAMITNDREAPSYAARGLELARMSGNRALAASLNIHIARQALSRRDLAAARTHLAESMEAALAIGRPSLQIDGLCCFAELLAEQGELECAHRVLTFASDAPSVSVPERDEIQSRLARLSAEVRPGPPRLPFDVRELVHRIVVETSIAHAPLIAALRGSG